jgi:hypothetical protein
MATRPLEFGMRREAHALSVRDRSEDEMLRELDRGRNRRSRESHEVAAGLSAATCRTSGATTDGRTPMALAMSLGDVPSARILRTSFSISGSAIPFIPADPPDGSADGSGDSLSYAEGNGEVGTPCEPLAVLLERLVKLCRISGASRAR